MKAIKDRLPGAILEPSNVIIKCASVLNLDPGACFLGLIVKELALYISIRYIMNVISKAPLFSPPSLMSSDQGVCMLL